jgi:hypothetical protein
MFRSILGRSGPQPDLERQLRAIEREAGEAHPGFDAPLFNRGGDLCLEANQRSRAMEYYGRAIDAYLRAGRFDAAGGVCRKLLRISPKAVRSHCTLAWLAIGKGLLGDAPREIAGYVDAARRARQEKLAAKQLRMMSEVAFDPEMRQLLADHLRELGDDGGAQAVVEGLADGVGVPPTAEDREELWAKVLRAALMGPDELKE